MTSSLAPSKCLWNLESTFHTTVAVFLHAVEEGQGSRIVNAKGSDTYHSVQWPCIGGQMSVCCMALHQDRMSICEVLPVL